ncbi:MAG: copper chaperone PCu(A)C [Aquabacterium sp.]|nr:MAG: copper chaperone PCu(A)C [Aquabacterium sp.]
MDQRIQRRLLLQGGFAIGASLLLPRARACEFFATSMRVLHPWTRASAPGADGVALYMKFDEVTQSDRLVGVRTPVAEGARMAGPAFAGKARQDIDFAIARGSTAEFTENGTHVRLTGLRQPIEVGRAYPLQLVFEKGGTINAQFEVDFPAIDSEGHGAHAGHTHSENKAQGAEHTD